MYRRIIFLGLSLPFAWLPRKKMATHANKYCSNRLALLAASRKSLLIRSVMSSQFKGSRKGSHKVFSFKRVQENPLCHFQATSHSVPPNVNPNVLVNRVTFARSIRPQADIKIRDVTNLAQDRPMFLGYTIQRNQVAEECASCDRKRVLLR